MRLPEKIRFFFFCAAEDVRGNRVIYTGSMDALSSASQWQLLVTFQLGSCMGRRRWLQGRWGFDSAASCAGACSHSCATCDLMGAMLVLAAPALADKTDNAAKGTVREVLSFLEVLKAIAPCCERWLQPWTQRR